jgi:hypothetical protein
MHGTALHTAGLGPFEAFLVVLVAVIGALLIHAISRRARSRSRKDEPRWGEAPEQGHVRSSKTSSEEEGE